MDAHSRAGWNWRWVVALSIAVLIFWVAMGIVECWELFGVLGVVAMASLALSFLLQIRDAHRKRLAQDQREEIG